jgi:hypothetical protein
MESIEELLEMFASPKANTRFEACEILRVSPKIPPEAVEALERHTEDPSPLVADAAKRALHVHKPIPRERVTSNSMNVEKDAIEEPVMTTSQMSAMARGMFMISGMLGVGLGLVVFGFLYGILWIIGYFKGWLLDTSLGYLERILNIALIPSAIIGVSLAFITFLLPQEFWFASEENVSLGGIPYCILGRIEEADQKELSSPLPLISNHPSANSANRSCAANH